MKLDCTSVTVRRGKREVLKSVSLTTEKPELIGLIGPNGAGKSSLMRAICSIQEFSGEIAFDGTPMSKLSANDIAHILAFLPQERVVHWPLPVREVVMLGRLPHRGTFGRAAKADHAAVDHAMEQIDVARFANRSFNALSGGEQARVLIARLVAQGSRYVIADEPTNGLDPAHQIGLMRLFRSFVNQGKTVMTSLHDLALASRWCDRILILDQGTLAADGAPQDVMNAAKIEDVYGVTTTNLSLDNRPLIVPTDLISTRLKTDAQKGAA